MGNLLTNQIEATSIILFGIGFTTLLVQKNLIKKVIGFNIMDSSIFMFVAAKGYIAGRAPPFIHDGIMEADHYINPLPGSLVMTGIVVAVSVTAFMLALCLRLYEYYGTLDMEKINLMSEKGSA